MPNAEQRQKAERAGSGSIKSLIGASRLTGPHGPGRDSDEDCEKREAARTRAARRHEPVGGLTCESEVVVDTKGCPRMRGCGGIHGWVHRGHSTEGRPRWWKFCPPPLIENKRGTEKELSKCKLDGQNAPCGYMRLPESGSDDRGTLGPRALRIRQGIHFGCEAAFSPPSPPVAVRPCVGRK